MRKIVLSMLVVASLSLSACSTEKKAAETNVSASSSKVVNSTSSSKEKKSSTNSKDKNKKSLAVQNNSAEKEPAKKENLSAPTSYQAILDEYTGLIQAAVPGLVQEFNNEAPANQNGVNGLAELSNAKIEKLAELSNEGISKMAELHFSQGSGKYEEYENWSGKLMDVYMNEATKITDAYMAAASSGYEAPISYDEHTVQQEQPHYSQEPVQEAAPAVSYEEPAAAAAPETSPEQQPAAGDTGVIQAGEGPEQVAARYGMGVDEFLQANGMTQDNYFLNPGQTVNVE